MADYIRIPPDSTGKRIRHDEILQIEVNTVVYSLNLLNIGDVITGGTSGVTSQYISHETELGVVYIHVKNATGTYTVGETLIHEGNDVADVVSSTVQYVQAISVVDGLNPLNRQKVDDRGSAYTRFSEGDMLFDAFGRNQTSQVSTIENHSFVYTDPADEKYYTDIRTGGNVVHSLVDSSLVFSTNTVSGSYSARTTHQYYPYTPGIGTETQMSVLVGDTGKAGVIRRWGLFDDRNGAFLQLSGSMLSVVLRNDSTGTVVDEVVDRSEFNGDSLESETTGEYLLDLSKYNLYWIDYQWLGVGRVRFGTFSPTGKRVVMHSFTNPNSKTVPYMNTGTLPMRIEQFNTTNVASTSEIRLVCAAILKQSNQPGYSGKYYTALSKRVLITSASYTPILSMAPVTTFNGKVNRITLIPTDIEYSLEGTNAVIGFVVSPNLTGSSFTGETGSNSAFIYDVDATSYTGGYLRGRQVLGSSDTRREFRENLENSVTTLASGFALTTSMVARATSGSGYITVLFRWKEVK